MMDYMNDIDDEIEVTHEIRKRTKESQLWIRRERVEVESSNQVRSINNPTSVSLSCLRIRNVDEPPIRDEDSTRRGLDIVTHIAAFNKDILRQEKEARDLIEHRDRLNSQRITTANDLYVRRSHQEETKNHTVETQSQTSRDQDTRIPGLSTLDVDERCGINQNQPVELPVDSKPVQLWESAVPAGMESIINATKPKKKKKNAPKYPRKIWLSSFSDDTSKTGIMNPGPFRGKKHMNSVKEALKEGEVEILFCPRKPPKNVYDNGYDNDVWEDDIPTISESVTSTVGNLNGNESEAKSEATSSEKSKNNRSEEILRLLNLKIQAKEKMDRSNQQLKILNNQNFILRSKLPLSELATDSRLVRNEQLQEKLNRQIEKLHNTLLSIESMIEEHRKLATEDMFPYLKKDIEYFDSGRNFCQFCDDELPSIEELLHHLHYVHLNNLLTIDTVDLPWTVNVINTDESDNEKNNITKLPLRGSEYLFPCRGFYCEVCKIFMGDEVMAKAHMKSAAHNTSYNNFCANNPSTSNEMTQQESELEEEIESLQNLMSEEDSSVDNCQEIDDDVVASDAMLVGEDTPDSSTAANSKAMTITQSHIDSDVILISDSDDDDGNQSIDDEFLYKGDSIEMKSFEDWI